MQRASSIIGMSDTAPIQVRRLIQMAALVHQVDREVHQHSSLISVGVLRALEKGHMGIVYCRREKGRGHVGLNVNYNFVI